MATTTFTLSDTDARALRKQRAVTCVEDAKIEKAKPVTSYAQGNEASLH